MQKFFASFMLLAVLCGLSAPVFADDAASAVTAAVSAVAAAPAAVVADAASAVAAAPVAAPVPNKGDTSWMIVATLLVIMMSIPGLALFYGGLVRSKNMLSVLMQVFSIFALITVLWTIYGYSLAFTEGSAESVYRRL
jgi:Amt family ammonium transporter